MAASRVQREEMTAQDLSRTGPPVGGACVTPASGLLSILTGSRAVPSVFIAVDVLLLAAALSGTVRTADRTPGCRSLPTGPAW